MWYDEIYRDVFRKFTVNQQQRISEWKDKVLYSIDPATINSGVIGMRGKNADMLTFDDVEGDGRPKFKTKQEKCDWLEKKLHEQVTATTEQYSRVAKLREEISSLGKEINTQQSTIEQLKATCYELTCQTQEQAGFIRAHEEAQKRELDSQVITTTRGELLQRGIYSRINKGFTLQDHMLDRPQTAGPKPWYKL